MTKQEKALAKELTKRIRMYERLVEKPETLSRRSLENCKVCNFTDGNCNDCVLKSMDGEWLPCMTYARYNLYALACDSKEDTTAISYNAELRLKEMLKAIKKAGYIYGV